MRERLTTVTVSSRPRTGVRTPAGAGAAHATLPSRVAGLDAIVAALCCVLIASRLPIRQGLNLGILISLATIPLWLGPLWRKRFGPLVVVLSGLAAASGALLTWFMDATHQTSTSLLQQNTLELIGLVTGIGFLIWAIERIGPRGTALWFGVGLLLAIGWRSVDVENPWKFSLSIPVIVFALALAAFARSRFVDLLVLAALAVVSVLNDSRSAAAMALATAAMLVCQGLLRRFGRESTPGRTLGWMALAGALVYAAMQWLILAGVFGAETRDRTLLQLREAGSILLGGRPEAGATLALFQYNPWGFGAGTLANATEVQVAKAGMARLNYDPNNGYVERYMLGNGFELHSIAGDLWAWFGFAGGALAITLLALVVWGVAQRLATRRANGLHLFLLFQVGWDTFFSPFFFTTISTLMLAVALTWPARPEPPEDHPAEETPPEEHDA